MQAWMQLNENYGSKSAQLSYDQIFKSLECKEKEIGLHPGDIDKAISRAQDCSLWMCHPELQRNRHLVMGVYLPILSSSKIPTLDCMFVSPQQVYVLKPES